LTPDPPDAHPDAQTPPEVMNLSEVSELFRVDPRTVTRWTDNGLLRCFRTPAGHRRFWRSDVEALIASTTTN